MDLPVFLLRLLLAACLAGVLPLVASLFGRREPLLPLWLAPLWTLPYSLSDGPGSPLFWAGLVLSVGTTLTLLFRLEPLPVATSVSSLLLPLLIGLGLYLPALAASLAGAAFLALALALEKHLGKRYRQHAYRIITREKASFLITLRQCLRDLGLQPERLAVSPDPDGFQVDILFHSSQEKHREWLDTLMQFSEVKEVMAEDL